MMTRIQSRKLYVATFFLLIIAQASRGLAAPVKLVTSVPGQIIINNGILRLTLSTRGDVLGIAYGGVRNFLKQNVTEDAATALLGGTIRRRGYYDSHGGRDDGPGAHEPFYCTSWKVKLKTSSRVTVEFFRPYSAAQKGSYVLPANVHLVYSVARGVPGFHSYILLDHTRSMPSNTLGELRFVLRLDPQLFAYTALSDDRRRMMPEADDIGPVRSESTAIPEARRIIHPTNAAFKYEVDHKYNYMAPIKEHLVYGWMARAQRQLGAWFISPSKVEYAAGGPLKQDLTVQTGAILLNYLSSTHIGTAEVTLKKGVPWKKIYGPFFFYLNKGKSREALWKDAKLRAKAESAAWPYKWAASPLPTATYPRLRKAVHGRLIVRDPYLPASAFKLSKGWIGLAPPGVAGSWSDSGSAYQFWIPLSYTGRFQIKNVRYGVYNLYAFVPGALGNFKYEKLVKISGTTPEILSLGDIFFRPLRSGRTIWEIGVPDRDSAEFYVPNMNTKSPYPYASGPNMFRNYGSWSAYGADVGAHIQHYAIGKSHPSRDWWYVQPSIRAPNGTYIGTRWAVHFHMTRGIRKEGNFTLWLALASSNNAGLRITANTVKGTGMFDSVRCNCTDSLDDNAMARGTSYGNYRIFKIPVRDVKVEKGHNVFYFSQRRGGDTPFTNVMYDYIRLEAPKNAH